MEHEFKKLRSANGVAVRVRSVGDWWEADPGGRLFRLAERAIEREWGQKPLYVREGGTMRAPPTLSAWCHTFIQAICQRTILGPRLWAQRQIPAC